MPISGKQAIRILQKNGFAVKRQQGSHVVLVARIEGMKYTTVVPMHKELRLGTIKSIAKLAGLDKKLFL